MYTVRSYQAPPSTTQHAHTHALTHAQTHITRTYCKYAVTTSQHPGGKHVFVVRKDINICKFLSVQEVGNPKT